MDELGKALEHAAEPLEKISTSFKNWLN